MHSRVGFAFSEVSREIITNGTESLSITIEAVGLTGEKGIANEKVAIVTGRESSAALDVISQKGERHNPGVKLDFEVHYEEPALREDEDVIDAINLAKESINKQYLKR